MTDDRPTELSRFLDFGEEVLEEASSILRHYFRKTISTRKRPFGVVTGADHAVESMFAEWLRGPFPIMPWPVRRRTDDRHGSTSSIAGCSIRWIECGSRAVNFHGRVCRRKAPNHDMRQHRCSATYGVPTRDVSVDATDVSVSPPAFPGPARDFLRHVIPEVDFRRWSPSDRRRDYTFNAQMLGSGSRAYPSHR